MPHAAAANTATTSAPIPQAPLRSYLAGPRLGALPAWMPGLNQLAAIAGSAVGGGAIGYVAAGAKEGILRGALMGMGLALLGDAIVSAKLRQWPGVALSGTASAASAGYAVWRLKKNRRW